jgi:hypothetical protein
MKLWKTNKTGRGLVEKDEEQKQPRPEEIIAELWRQIREMRAAGKTPEKIVMPVEKYRMVQAWHVMLGELSDPSRDYITRHTIFNLPVFIETRAEIRVY